MEWNVKWDWGNHEMFGSKACGSPKELQLTDWGVEEEGELDAGSFNLTGGGSGSGDYGSDMGRGGSSVKSSISASTDSSTKEGLKASSFSFGTFDGSPRNTSKKVELCQVELSGNSPPTEASVGSFEPLTGLKLGKRTFENNCGGSNAKVSSVPIIPVSSAAAKKTKSSSQKAPIPRCQVVGCNLDLSSAKDYHRKHRVCDNHAKCPKVIVSGLERRFCQQCSRFHSLSEFDEKKRSCRRRLSDHNARRRKPHQETFQFNSTRLYSSFYDSRQSMNLVLDHASLVQSKTATNFSWESTQGSKFTITRGFTSKPDKASSISGQPLVGGIQFPRSISVHNNSSSLLLASKGNTAELYNQGVKESVYPSNTGAAPELPRALSLLSTNSWGATEPESVSLDHPMHANQGSMPEQVMHEIPEGLPLVSTEYWQAEQHSCDPRVQTLGNGHNSGSFQEIQRFKAPFETDFYFNALN